jgi:dipeptidyl aminopeptidase/acylaminoacyl peptidase
MKLAALLALLLVTAPVASADPEAVPLQPYASVRNLGIFTTEADYDAALADKRFRMERIAYASDGLTVHAYVYRPVAAKGRLPVVVFNRGGWTHQSFASEMVSMAHRMAQRGYLVVAPIYRGSGGDAGTDEMGGADLADLFNLLPAIRAMPDADADRLFLYGESRGGMMVYQALRDGFPARAAAVVGAFTDLEAMLANPRWASAGVAIWPDLATNRAAIVERRSAIRWPGRIGAPVLIMHGGADESVELDQAKRMAAALKASGKPHDFQIFEGEGHVIAGKALERDARAADWFARN